MSSRHLLTEGRHSSEYGPRAWRATFALLTALAAAFAVAPGALADDWQKRHRDPANTGFAYPDNTGTQSPGLAGLELVWTYPWPVAEDKWMDQVVDDIDTALFSASGPWQLSSSLSAPSPNSYEGSYLYIPVWTPDSAGVPKATARWNLDLAGAPTGSRYLVYVWFPSSTDGMTNSQNVTYTVREADGSTYSQTINQGAGGEWVQIGTRAFTLDDSSFVEVSNVSTAQYQIGPPIPGQPSSGYDYVDKGRFVMADAIRIVQDLGSIYSSPAVFTSAGLPGGAAKGVVFGIVDRDPAGRQSDTEITHGRVVCVDAINGPDSSDTDAFNSPLWSYPPPPNERTSDLEGPIAGGVFSSPLVVDTSAGKTVFIGSDDGQIYALNANNGHLRWSGPGKTLDDASTGVSGSGFSQVGANGGDYFGRDYLAAPATLNADTHSITYTFSGLDKYYYNVYAWLPAVRSDEERVSSASYAVESDSGTAKFGVNQNACELGPSPNCDCRSGTNGGKWVQIGNASFLPKSGTIKITLTSRADRSPCNAGRTQQVVADAIRLIPDQIGAFGYCAPTASSTSGTVSRIYSANSGGRIIALDAGGNGDGSTSTIWVYPKTRTDSSESDLVSLGGMSGTPAIDGTRLFYGSTSGRVGMLEQITSASPSEGWTAFTDDEGNELSNLGSFTSSPMVDGQFVFFAASQGTVYKVDKSNGKVAAGWPYPTADGWTEDTTEAPKPVAGAFRYSSPAKAIVNGTSYVVVGSADSNLHQIPMAGPGPVRKLETPGSIYSSPATVTESGTVPESAYFGTQSGVFFATSLDDSDASVWGWDTLAESVFSSPAISDQWAYVGGDDGRLYAFVDPENNGGAGWPINNDRIRREPPGAQYDAEKSGGSGYFDLEVVSEADYNNPERYFDQAGLYSESKTNRHPNGNPPSEFEWGETIYVLGWTFKNQNARMTFRMQNQGQGEEAGALMTATQTASAKYSKQVEVDGEFGDLYYAKFAWVLDATKLITPGSAYTIVGQLRAQATQGSTAMSLSASVPKDNDVSSIDVGRKSTPDRAFTINNPLAISIPKLGFAGPGWKSGLAGRPFQPRRDDYGTKFNGMYDSSSGIIPINAIPTLGTEPARHGANSQPELVYLADRSMLGYTRPNNPQTLINSLRVGRNDLAFPGGALFVLPWERQPISGTINNSLDYPDISSNNLVVTKKLDGANPTRGAARLLPTTGPDVGGPEERWATPDPLEIVLEVPKYQPPAARAYGTRVQAWIDATARGTDRGQLDLADRRVTGRPLDGSEVYREWNYEVGVLPDFNLYAEERTIDVGKRPIGFGISAPVDDFLPFSSFPSSALFRPFTVRNDGNVNAVEVRVLNTLPTNWVPGTLRNLFSDQVQALDFNRNGALDVGEGHALPAANIVSSLDPAYDSTIPQALPVPGFSHVISKPRVGDLGPTTLRIPDQRQYDYLKGQSPGTDYPEPALPLISLRVPIGTPAGTYSQVVPIVAQKPSGMNINYPVTNPSFTLAVTVREGRLTDGVTTGSLPQVDVPVDGTPQWGDAQPAPYRVWSGAPGNVTTGPMGLLWSSNRETDTVPGQPWSIFSSLLDFDTNRAAFAPQVPGSGPAQWWRPVSAAQAWPVPSDLASLFPGEPDGLPGTIVPSTVKFTSPSVGQDPLNGGTWFVLAGQVDKTTGAGAPVNTEYRIFYARADGNGLFDPAAVRSIPSQDFTTPKFSPRMLVYQGDVWVFWYASVGGQYRLFFSVNRDNGTPGGWSADTQLVIPGAVSAAAEPVAMYRRALRRPDPVSARPPERDDYIDVIYSGISRARGDADLLLTRYRVSRTSLSISTLARVYNEELKRDTRSIGLYTGRHLAWIRPSGSGRSNYPVIAVWRWDPADNKFVGPDMVSDAPVKVDSQTGLVQYDTAALNAALGNRYGKVILDPSAGTVKFEKPLPVKDRVVADYTPQTWRLTDSTSPDTAPFALLEKTLRPLHNVDRSIFPPDFNQPLAIDRMWAFWRQGQGALPGNTIYYKTMRLGIKLQHPVALETDGSPSNVTIYDGDNGGYGGPWEFDWANNRLLFPEEAENANIWVEYLSSDGNVYTEPSGHGKSPYRPLTWITELDETPLPVDSMVNEGQVFAFADPDGLRNPSDARYKPSLIWVFWTSTRAGSTDLYYQTISPNFRAVTRQ